MEHAGIFLTQDPLNASEFLGTSVRPYLRGLGNIAMSPASLANLASP